MLLNLPNNDFRSALKTLAPISPNNPYIPSTSHVLFDSTMDGTVQMTATDTQIWVQYQLPEQALDAGQCTAPASRMKSLSELIPRDSCVRIEREDEGVVAISFGKAKARLFTYDTREFPTIPNRAVCAPFTIPSKQFIAAVHAVTPCMCRDKLRFQLCGLRVEAHGGELVFIATDGRRMSVCTVEAEMPKELVVAATIPARAINVALHYAALGPDVMLDFSKTHCYFACGPVWLMCALTDGTFPDYKKLIPMERHTQVLTFDLAEFKSAMRRVVALSGRDAPAVVVQVTPDYEYAVISCNAKNEGSSVEQVGVEQVGVDEPLRFSINPAYVLDSLGSIGTEKVVLRIKDPSSAIFVLENYPDTSHKAVNLSLIMPIRT